MSAGAPQYGTLAEALKWHALSGSSNSRLLFPDGGPGAEVPQREIWERALKWGGYLRQLGLGRDEPCLLMLPTSSDFLFAFLGVGLAGAIPCPLALPGVIGAAADFKWRTSQVVAHLGARLVITRTAYARHVREAAPGITVHV